MKLTTLSATMRASCGMRPALVIDQLRLQTEVGEPLECDRNVLGRNLDAVDDAAQRHRKRTAGSQERLVG
jgi:hypothetical protein